MSRDEACCGEDQVRYEAPDGERCVSGGVAPVCFAIERLRGLRATGAISDPTRGVRASGAPRRETLAESPLASSGIGVCLSVPFLRCRDGHKD